MYGYNDNIGLEQYFMEPENPYRVSFEDLFTKENRSSVQELSLKMEVDRIKAEMKESKELKKGNLPFYKLVEGKIPEKAPHLKPFIQKVLGPLTSKEYTALSLTMAYDFAEKKAASKMNIARRTFRTYRQRALEKLFKNLPKQETNINNFTWDSFISLGYNPL